MNGLLKKAAMSALGLPTHKVVAGMTVCLNADGRGYKAHEPDRWTFCPYCGGRLEAKA